MNEYSLAKVQYFNFTKTQGHDNIQLLLRLIPAGIEGTITILADRPWTSQGGIVLGSIQLKADMPQTTTEMTATLPALSKLTGKHALFFVFSSKTKEKSLCTLQDFQFK